jgi:hypothetical protein
MVDQLVLLNDPTQAAFTTAVAVSVVVTVRGAATMFTGTGWPRLKALLGRRGAIAKALGRDVPLGPLSEARVLRAVTLLPVVLAVPAVWLVLTPGLWPFGTLLTVGAVLAAWARMPLNRWVEGATGASLNNTAKAGTIALGGAVSAALLGRYSTLVGERVAAGQPYADVVAAGNLRLALLVIPVVVVPAVVAHLVGKLRVGTLDELRTALERTGTDEATAARIGSALAARGINDVGSARALFLPSGWRPRVGARWRLAAAETRRKSIGLTPEEHERLLAALETFADAPSRGQGSPSRLDRVLRGSVGRVLAVLGVAAVAVLADGDPAVAAVGPGGAVGGSTGSVVGAAVLVATVLVVRRAAVHRVRRAFADVQTGLSAMLHDVGEARARLATVDPGERPFALQLLTDAETGLHRLGRLLSGPGGWLLRPRQRSELAASVTGGLAEVGVARRFHDVLAEAERAVEPGPAFWTAATRVLAELVVMQREPVRIGPMRRRLVEVLAPIWARTPPHALPWPFLDAPPEWTQEQVDHAQWDDWSRKDRLTMHLATLLDRYLPGWYARR